MIGFIGTGNMGGALATAAAKQGFQVYLSDASQARAEQLAAEIGGQVSTNEALAESADVLVLGLKPQGLPNLLVQLGPILRRRGPEFLLISMATGVTVDKLKAMIGAPQMPVIRIMPNLAVSVGEGTILYTASPEVSQTQKELFAELLAAAGHLHPLDERLIDAGSAVNGCGPAFVAMMIEAMADGAVACGIARADALTFAEEMCLGTAKLLLQQQKHPAKLKDEVCSPGGTTIQGVLTLEQKGFRSAMFEAVVAAYEANARLR